MDKKFFAILIVAVVVYLLLVSQAFRLYDFDQATGALTPRTTDALTFSIVIGLVVWGSMALVGKSRSMFDSIAEMTLFKDSPAAALLMRK